MIWRTVVSLASPVLATAAFTGAQILSCADVECPIIPGTTGAACTVADRTFNAVGVADMNSTADSLWVLSWVKGVGARDVNSTERTYIQSFYLGRPEGFDFGGTGACALFFTQVSDSVRFGGDDARGTEGTCGEAMTDACVSALTDRAKKISGLSGADACERLQQDFDNHLDSACAAFAQGSRWAGIRAKALSGDGAPEPISEQQNSTSTCWPVLPKSHGLTLVESVDTTGDLKAETVMDNFFSVTPILTVFFPASGNNSAVLQPEALLTCLKAVDLTTASNETRNSGEGGESATGRMAASAAFAAWGGLISVALAMLLG